jgi:hypothetical protein
MEAGTTPAPEATGGSPQRSLLLAAGLGGAVALALGIYGNVHEPSEDLVFEPPFGDSLDEAQINTIAEFVAGPSGS